MEQPAATAAKTVVKTVATSIVVIE
jgi:hypothetical protein